jgi:hypothetical protein
MTLVPRPGGKTIFGCQGTIGQSPSQGQPSTLQEIAGNAGAAGGQFIILPYPAANESSGIYSTIPSAVLILAAWSSISITHALWYRTLRLSLESILFGPAPKVFRRRVPVCNGSNAASPQQDRKSSFTLIRRFPRRKMLSGTAGELAAP